MLDSPRSSLASTSRSRDGDSEECKDGRRSILAASFSSRLRAPSRQEPSPTSATDSLQAVSQHPSHLNRTNRREKTTRTG